MKRFYLGSIVIVVAIFSGCGYTTRSTLSKEFKTIYIAPVENKIDITQEADMGNRYRLYKPQLETKLTQAIINRFLTDSNLRPNASDASDLMLKTALVEFRQDPLRYDDNDEVMEYRVIVRVQMSLRDNRQGKGIWQEDSFSGEATYITPGHSGARSQDVAIDEAIADLARRIVERTIEAW
jgi:hypothetical protein